MLISSHVSLLLDLRWGLFGLILSLGRIILVALEDSGIDLILLIQIVILHHHIIRTLIELIRAVNLLLLLNLCFCFLRRLFLPLVDEEVVELLLRIFWFLEMSERIEWWLFLVDDWWIIGTSNNVIIDVAVLLSIINQIDSVVVDNWTLMLAQAFNLVILPIDSGVEVLDLHILLLD